MSALNPQLRNFAAQVALTAGASAATIKSVDTSTDYIYVTRFIILIAVVANGKKTTMTDSAGSPVSYVAYTDLTVATGINQTGYVSYDFGKRGIKLTQGKNLTVTSEGSGSAGFAYAEGYQSSI
jgi:hypothetical protein